MFPQQRQTQKGVRTRSATRGDLQVTSGLAESDSNSTPPVTQTKFQIDVTLKPKKKEKRGLQRERPHLSLSLIKGADSTSRPNSESPHGPAHCGGP
jgi:hypothetical protein